MKRLGVVLLFCGAGLFVVSIYFWLTGTDLSHGSGIRVQGTVTRLEESDFELQPHPKERVARFPIVEFQDAGGGSHEIRTNGASFPPEYAVGDKVNVVYRKNAPERGRIARFTEIYFEAIFLSVFSNLLFFFGAFVLGLISLPALLGRTKR